MSFDAEPLPAVSFKHMRFVLADDAVAAQSGKLLINMIRVNDPLWTLACETNPLRETDVQTVLAWKERRKGGLRSVLGVQNVICRPIAHAASSKAAPARTQGKVANVEGNEITVAGVHADLNLAANDMFGLLFKGMRALCRVQSVSKPSPNSRVLTVEPLPPSYAAEIGAAVIFENPPLVMRMVPGSFSAPTGRMPTLSWQLVESRL